MARGTTHFSFLERSRSVNTTGDPGLKCSTRRYQLCCRSSGNGYQTRTIYHNFDASQDQSHYIKLLLLVTIEMEEIRIMILCL